MTARTTYGVHLTPGGVGLVDLSDVRTEDPMARRLTSREHHAATATEADILQAFFDLEDKAGIGYVFHIRDARGQRLDGCPDIIVILPNYLQGDGVVGLFEVKTMRDRMRGRQDGVVAACGACSRVVSGIVRPIPREGEVTLTEALAMLGVDLA